MNIELKYKYSEWHMYLGSLSEGYMNHVQMMNCDLCECYLL